MSVIKQIVYVNIVKQNNKLLPCIFFTFVGSESVLLLHLFVLGLIQVKLETMLQLERSF